MTDLISQLRNYDGGIFRGDAERLMAEAADRIEQLEAQLAEAAPSAPAAILNQEITPDRRAQLEEFGRQAMRAYNADKPVTSLPGRRLPPKGYPPAY